MIAAINTSRSGLLSSNGCQGSGYGCTDPTALNYDPSATIDDGSCCYVAGCTDPTANNYNSSACYDDGSCVFPVYGCTDPIATNFDPLATNDDGSCCYGDQLVITIITDNYPAETSWQLVNQSGGVVQSISAGDLTNANTSYTWNICPSSTECYDFTIYDAYGDGICCNYGNGSYTVTYNGSVVASGGSFSSSETTSSIGSCITSVVGCMNSNASNYDPLANTSIAFGGIVDPNNGTGGYYSGNQHLIFNANVESKIVSAVVYAQSSKTITFELRDNSSTVIDDTTITIPLGGQRLYFDFDVPIGNDYQLGIAGTSSQLYRNNGGVSYPYDIGSLINITGSSAGTGGYYYFFYDIEVEAVCTGITSSVYGCTDPTAINYDSTATIDDGSCIAIVYGCTDSLAFNYYGGATVDDGTCVYVAGCTDATACNYDLLADFDDGSCEWTSCAGVCANSAPTGLNATNVLQNRATINWDNMNDANCMVDQYRIKYSGDGGATWTTKTMGQPVNSCLWAANNTDKLILNLTPSTTYEYQMKAWYCDGSGNGVGSAWSAMSTFTTEDDCPNVGNLAVATPSNTKATFTWDDSNGPYSFVRIKTRVDTNNATWFNVGGMGVNYGIFTKDKNNLTPGTSYRGQARTWCDPNGGAWKAPTWTSLIYWTQPTVIRMEGGSSIANLAIYPNPSRDIFNVTFTSEDVQDLKLRILNVVGEELINENLEQFIGEYTKQIDLTNNAKGIYFLEISTNNGVVNKKLILQ